MPLSYLYRGYIWRRATDALWPFLLRLTKDVPYNAQYALASEPSIRSIYAKDHYEQRTRRTGRKASGAQGELCTQRGSRFPSHHLAGCHTENSGTTSNLFLSPELGS
eukprot:IDg11238t1